MAYDEDGRFLYADLVTDPAEVVRHAHWRDAALHQAIPYLEYMSRAVELYRAPGRCACPAGIHGRACKHSLAVRLMAAEPAQEQPLEDVALDPVTARKRARDEAFRAQHSVFFGAAVARDQRSA